MCNHKLCWWRWRGGEGRGGWMAAFLFHALHTATIVSSIKVETSDNSFSFALTMLQQALSNISGLFFSSDVMGEMIGTYTCVKSQDYVDFLINLGKVFVLFQVKQLHVKQHITL